MTKVPIVRLAHGADLPLPSYQTEGAAGLDLYAAIPLDQPMVLMPGQRELVPTGITCALPRGVEGQVRPRSGLAAKTGVTVLNAPGTIDSDYRGEIQVLLINHGPEPYQIVRGARIAQLAIAPILQATLVEEVELRPTIRGLQGFGSTDAAS